MPPPDSQPVHDARLGQALQALPDPVLLLDAGGQVRFRNAAAARLGRTDSLLAVVQARLTEAAASAGPLRGEVLLGTSTGLRSHEYSLSCLPAGEGEALFTLTLRETTERARERERLRLNEERYRLLAQHATDLISRHSPEGVFLYASPASERITGYAAHDLIGHSLYEFMHPEDLLALSRAAEFAGTTGEPQVRSYRFRHRRGHFVWLETTLHTVASSLAGAEGELVAVSRDISRRKEAEAAIHALNETLEQRVAERTAAAEQRARELKRSNDDLAQFAYVASHDLQEPLRVVASYLQLLDRKSGGTLEPDSRRYLDRAHAGCRRMHTLIQDLLAYSRVGTQGRAFRPVPVDQPLQAALANLQVAIEESGARVAAGPLPKVTADSTQLTLLFQNLIGNALKFRAETPPTVRVEAAERSGEWLFSVRDNGIGIPPEFHERVFRVFQRLHTREEYPGNGIGLSICRKIVERHGGSIWVESAGEGGTTFFFTLPVAPPPESVEEKE